MVETSRERLDVEELSADLTARICDLVGSVIARSQEDAESDFEHLFLRAQNLYARKQEMLGTKSETRDLLYEIVFSRLRRCFRSFMKSEESTDEIKAAEWVLGAVVGAGAMGEFAAALDGVILQSAAPADYSFAGRADFISIEDVMQMLGSGKHQGRLSLEKDDNRIDLYVHRGQVAFMDPHHLVRRILPGASQINFREIKPEQIEAAEACHAADGVPLFLTLNDLGCFRDMDLRMVVRQLGCEVLYEFLHEQERCNFFYRQLDELPGFVLEHNLRLSVTPLLLEGNKKLDDWRSLVKVFPDSLEPIQPAPDMLAKISNLNLGVLEIKMLSFLTGDNSPKTLTEQLGLPLFEIYQHLLTFARAGAIVAPGGVESLESVTLSIEESMQVAFDALDANDDNLAVSSVLDKVLGGDDDDGGGLFGGGGGGGGGGSGGGGSALDMFRSKGN